MIVAFGSAVSCITAAESELACGPACIFVAANLLGREQTEQSLEVAFSRRLRGEHSLNELIAAAHTLGLETRLVQGPLQAGDMARLPLIVALRRPNSHSHRIHYVVVYGHVNDHVQIIDYPNRPRLISVEKLADSCSDVGLYVALTDEQLTEEGIFPVWALEAQVFLAVSFSVLLVAQLCIKTSRRFSR